MSEDWLKLHTEIIDDPKMTELTDFEFRIFISLLCVARQKHDDGRIIMTPQELSWRLRYSVTDIETSLDKLLKLNILTYVTGGVTVVNYCKRQYSESFLRVKRYRERKRNVTETLRCNGTSNAIVTRDKNRIDKNREEKTLSVKPDAYSTDFEEFWKIYPARNGIKQSKKQSWQYIKQHKINLKDLLIAVENYKRGDDVKKGYVKDCFTWLKVWEDWLSLPEQKSKVRLPTPEEEAKMKALQEATQ